MDIGLTKPTINRTSKVDAVRLYASYRLNLLLLKGQRCVYQILLLSDEYIIRKRLKASYFQILQPINVEISSMH